MILKRELYQRHGYFKGILIVLSLQMSRLLKLFLSLFKKEESLLNNSEDQANSNLRGMLALTVNEKGDLQCDGCELCQVICPSDCIDLEFDKKKQVVEVFNIDLLRCAFCGLCQEACPIDGIRHTAEVPSPGHAEQNWTVGISTLAFRQSLNDGKGLLALSSIDLDKKKKSSVREESRGLNA